jgi:hypothetical protein
MTTTLKLTPLMESLKLTAEREGLLTTVTAGPADQQVDMLVYNASDPRRDQLTISSWISPAGRPRHAARRGLGYTWKVASLNAVPELLLEMAK